MYFKALKKGGYDINGDGVKKLVTDLFTRVKMREKILDEASLYDSYDVPEGERPEVTAFKHFGDTELHWVILLTNNITDVYYDWPLSFQDFETFIKNKYANPDGVHHYEITQSSGPQVGSGPSDYDHKIEVNSTVTGAQSVSNREYEQRLQDQKRSIKLLDPAYLTAFIEEFENLVKN
jgi:hypothetical protein